MSPLLSLLATTRCVLPDLQISSEEIDGFGGATSNEGGSRGEDDEEDDEEEEPDGSGGGPDITMFCTPGEASCDENSVITCNEQGDGFLAVTVECSATQTCEGGECRDQQCTPSSTFCLGDEVMKCAKNGLSSSSEHVCGTGEYCDTESATCKDGTCAPNQPTCDGTRATTCNANGSGYLTEGMECTAGTTCQAGICVPHICTPGTSLCEDKKIITCADNGLSASETSTCKSDEYCAVASETAACHPQVCAPNATDCSGNTARLCNASGSAYGTTTDCTSSNQTCLGGSCEGECAPGQLSCEDNTQRTCSASGSWVNEATCTDQTCVDGVCEGVCAPGQLSCASNTRRTCSASGSWVNEAACTNQACVGGVCEGVCTPGQRMCNGLQPRECNASGTWANSGSACPFVCSGQGVCSGGCVPGSRRCTGSGNLTHQTCNSSGNWATSTQSANADGCNTYHLDVDNDGYGTSSSQCWCAPNGNYRATQGGDCCDSDSNVRPNQTSCFTSPNACGNYDYDCNSVNAKCNIDGVNPNQCADNCAHQRGWESVGSCPRSCGQSGNWHYAFTACSPQWRTETQACR